MCVQLKIFHFSRLPLVSSVFLYRFLTQVASSGKTTGMILSLLKSRATLIPVESLLVLDLQDGGVMVQDGQNDFVHILSQA